MVSRRSAGVKWPAVLLETVRDVIQAGKWIPAVSAQAVHRPRRCRARGLRLGRVSAPAPHRTRAGESPSQAETSLAAWPACRPLSRHRRSTPRFTTLPYPWPHSSRRRGPPPPPRQKKYVLKIKKKNWDGIKKIVTNRQNICRKNCAITAKIVPNS